MCLLECWRDYVYVQLASWGPRSWYCHSETSATLAPECEKRKGSKHKLELARRYSCLGALDGGDEQKGAAGQGAEVLL